MHYLTSKTYTIHYSTEPDLLYAKVPTYNTIYERANQTLGNMIRKLTDKEYTSLKVLALPAFQYAMNITPHSSIGCSPFEAGHGLPAQSVTHARLLAQQTLRETLIGRHSTVRNGAERTR